MRRLFKKRFLFAILFTRTSAAIRPRTLQSIEGEFAENKVPTFGCQLNDREAYRTVFAFPFFSNDMRSENPGTIVLLDPHDRQIWF
jgi:hypothetical protein